MDVAFVSERVASAVVRQDPARDMHTGEITLESAIATVSVHVIDEAMLAELCQIGWVTEDTHHGVSEEAAFDVFCKLKPVCSACLRDWVDIHNRTDGCSR